MLLGVLCLSAAELPPAPASSPIAPAQVGPAAGLESLPKHYQAITTEALRPNGDKEGRALPLAARWTANNFHDIDMSGPEGRGISYLFNLKRVMDDVDAGHYLMPFIAWPAPVDRDYFQGWNTMEPAFKRLAQAGLPFEVEAGNIEDHMFVNNPDPDWNRPMAENPANIRADMSGKVQAAVAAGASEFTATVWKAGTELLPAGAPLIFAGHGHVYTLAAPLVANAEGVATVKLATPLLKPLAAGEVLAHVSARMDFWSAAPTEVWERAGGNLVFKNTISDMATWKAMAAGYPNPPQVQIVSNNEGGGKVSMGEAAGSWHWATRQAEFAKQFPEPREDSLDRLAYAQGYVDKMRAYLRGMRRALPWKEQSILAIAYNGFGVNFEVGRWGGWRGNPVPLGKADMYEWLAWDGSAPDFYTYDWNYATDEHIGSPHIGAMQAYAMQVPSAEKNVPGYQWQLALWDGGVKKRFNYAQWGELPRTRKLGTVATAITTSGAQTIDITGAKPNSLVLRQGEMFSVEGHSEYRLVACQAGFDHLAINDPTASSGALGALAEGSDLGGVDLRGSTTYKAGRYEVYAAGTSLAEERYHFASAPWTDGTPISVHIAHLTNLDIGPRPGIDGWKPVTIANITARKKLPASIDCGSKAGLLLRNNAGQNAGFVALTVTPGGEIALSWRVSDWQAIATAPPVAIAAGATPWLKLERDGTAFVASYAIDGKTWKPVGRTADGVTLGKDTRAGLVAVAYNQPSMRLRMYSAAADVRADDKGVARIPLGTLPQAGPVAISERFPPIAPGAPVWFHNYMDRYEGLATYALWQTRPRILREFAWGEYNGVIEQQWQRCMRAVDGVWADPVLTRFWRLGTLVVNPEYEAATGHKHPMWELTDDDEGGRVGPWLGRWKKQDRFYQLSCPLNPPFKAWPQRYEVGYNTLPDSNNAVIKVWALAYVLGEAPKRQWLLLAQSPRQDRKAVQISIPGFGKTVVDVARSGSFYRLVEGQAKPEPVGLLPAVPRE